MKRGPTAPGLANRWPFLTEEEKAEGYDLNRRRQREKRAAEKAVKAAVKAAAVVLHVEAAYHARGYG